MPGRDRPAIARIARHALTWTALSGLAAPAARAQSLDVLDQFARRLAADVAADGVGGITAGVFRGDQLLWAQGFGWADPEARVPAGVRTIYRTGSISKSFTAVLLADLAEDGVVRLDDPVEGALPEARGLADPPAGAPPITFRQLASHTAGLIREPELDGAAAGPIDDWGHKILASIPHTRFYGMPGRGYRYSNIGFGMLGYALQRAAGSSFMRLMETRIFVPLGMSSTTFIVGPGLARRLAVGLANGDDGAVDAELPAREHAGRGYKVPNGGVYSTVGDLATFAAAVMGRTELALLGDPMRAEVLRPQTPPESETRYGLGFFLREVVVGGRAVTFAGHGGSVAGYNAYIVFEPASGYGVVLLRNYNRGATNLGRAGDTLLQALLEAG